jgi:hypothetical protein
MKVFRSICSFSLRKVSSCVAGFGADDVGREP